MSTHAAPLFGRTATWLNRLPPDPDGKLVVFTACDSRYLDFAVSLARSLDAFSPGSRVVIHVANPSNLDVSRLQDLRSTLTRTSFGISVENIDLTSLSGEARRAYFASMRFLRMAEIHLELGAPVLCLDADSLVVQPIDHDFTNKPNPDLLLVIRDTQADADPRMAVANGSVWIAPSEPARAWLDAVRGELEQTFRTGEAAWFVDQVIVARQIKGFKGRIAVFNIKPRYADWEFRPSSVVWAGKGQRKSIDMRFAMLQQILSDSPHRQVQAMRVASEAFSDRSEANADMRRKIRIASTLVPPRVALFLPRLDQPWGSGWRTSQVPPRLADDTLELRLHWASFAARLANAIERKGVAVDLHQAPAALIQPESVDASGADLALVPHRCHLDFATGNVPVHFYMQEYFRWVFVVDSRGWSAASSAYPMAVDRLSSGDGQAFECYRERLGGGLLASKFSQPPVSSRRDMVSQGVIPSADYLFFPLQIPHDQSIRYFADVTEREVVVAVLAWSRRSGVPVVFKPHPANPKSMREFELLAAQDGAYWSTAHVHDLIQHARVVATINSGVGFEALLHAKPVITFGRAEYDCVTIQATPETMDSAWRTACEALPEILAARYRRFVDWFLSDYAVDLSRPDAAERRFDTLAHEIAVAARVSHASRLAELELEIEGSTTP